MRVSGNWLRRRRMRRRPADISRWPRFCDGGTRSDASRIGGVELQVIRNWALRFNADGPKGLIAGKAPAQPPKLENAQRQALARIVEGAPVPAVHRVVRWRLRDLAQWMWEQFRISLDETTVSRELKALGFAKVSARPRHYAQNELAIEGSKKTFLAAANRELCCRLVSISVLAAQSFHVIMPLCQKPFPRNSYPFPDRKLVKKK